MEIGDKGYSAQVVVAMRSNGKLLLYDILQMEPATIQAKNKKSNAAIAKNPSPGTDRSTASGFTDSISETGGDVNGRYSLKERDREYLSANPGHSSQTGINFFKISAWNYKTIKHPGNRHFLTISRMFWRRRRDLNPRTV